MKKVLIPVISLLAAAVIIICFIMLDTKPPKLKNIEAVRVEYNPRLIKALSLTSPLEINDTEQIGKLVDCFNAESEYDTGCDCTSNDITVRFISKEQEYVYNIGITGDPRIQYSEVPDKDIFGIDINDIINILNKNRGSENLKYPY